MDETTAGRLQNLFLALSDKTRIRLLALMNDGEVSVGFLADELGESQPKISRHLAYLRNAGLVSTRRDGKWIHYAIDPQLDPSVAIILRFALDAALGLSVKMNTPPIRPMDTPRDRIAGMQVVRTDELPIYLL